MNNKKEKSGFLTFCITRSKSCDYYSYVIRTKTKPGLEQLEWWLKMNASDKSKDYCYECIIEYQTIDLDNLPEITKLHIKDPAPHIGYL